MEYEICRTDDVLYHWGIKGMKWGIRRYQNKDGSLTPAGKKRYDQLEGELEKLGGRRKRDIDDGVDAAPRRKSASEMSDDELMKAINRARMEDTYRQLRPEPVVEKNPFMKKMVNEVVTPALMSSGKKFLESSINKATEKIMKGKVDPNSYEALKKTYDKLKLQSDIIKLKNNPEGETNWENMIKKQTYETNKADRDAKMRGYKDAIDEALQKSSAAKAEQARAANESKSREYYDASYRQVGGEKTTVGSGSSNGLALYNNSGKNYMTAYSGWDSNYSSVSKSDTTSDGAVRAASIIDKYGNEFILPKNY